MSNKRYFWLKLNENFFEDDTIQWLEEQENGKDYVIFYLKLCLKSLSGEGKLIRYVGERLIPYDVKALGKVTNTSPDTVAVAMKSFLEIGLVDKLETGEIYMTQINEMIGTETDAARRKRRQRAREAQLESTGQVKVENSDNVTGVSQEGHTEIDIEKEIDIELEKDKDTEAKNVSVVDYKDVNEFYQNNFGVLSPYLAENLKFWCDDVGPEMVLEAMKIANKSQKPFTYAEGIIKNWERTNIKSIEDIEANEVARSKQKSIYNRPVTQKEKMPSWNTKPVDKPVNKTENPADDTRPDERSKAIQERLERMEQLRKEQGL